MKYSYSVERHTFTGKPLTLPKGRRIVQVIETLPEISGLVVVFLIETEVNEPQGWSAI